MAVPVFDVRSNPADQIAHVVEVLGRSTQRIAIFKAIYFGKQRVKTVNDIALSTGLDRVRVLTEGKRLADNQIVKQVRTAGITGYEKDPFFAANKGKILRLTQDPVAFAGFPTKARPRAAIPTALPIRIPRQLVRARFITVDDIDSFSRVARVRVEPGDYTPIPEARFKAGVARIIGESGEYHDWGGERNDLHTTRLRLDGRRALTAIGFKGPGTKGILTPKKMGKNGDQIQRLFKSPASVFLVQYWGQIDQSVTEQMEEFAKAKSAVEQIEVCFGIIDGDDSNHLLKAYPRAFRR